MIVFCTMLLTFGTAFAKEDVPVWVEVQQGILNTDPTQEALGSILSYEHEYLGEFSVTAYCGCSSCNGIWTGYPAKNGEPLEDGFTIAVDPKVIPLGSYVFIEGVGVRKAQDTGSAIDGKDIDLYFGTHSQTGKWGRRTKNVWLLKEPGQVLLPTDILP